MNNTKGVKKNSMYILYLKNFNFLTFFNFLLNLTTIIISIKLNNMKLNNKQSTISRTILKIEQIIKLLL